MNFTRDNNFEGGEIMEPTFDIKQEKLEDNYGKFIISPLLGGYGYTMGQALKRVLLTSIPGAAIQTVRIEGVKHQFSTLKGMKEDVLDFLLNLKQVRVSYTGEKAVKLELNVKGPGEVKASQIKTSGSVSISNPDLVLANLAKGSKLEAEMEVVTGVGYSSAEERPSDTIGEIALDAIFSPVTRVNYKVEETRVGRVTNYDKLTLEIWTDGTIDPESALVKASKTLMSYFGQVVAPKASKTDSVAQLGPDDSLGLTGKLSVEEIGLPTRVANALVKSGYDTVEKLVKADKNDLIKVRNLGEKSLKVIKAALIEKGVEFNNA